MAARVLPLSRRSREYLDRTSRDQTALKPGEVFRDIEGAFHLVQYVNTSGAYAVPLASNIRQIGDKTVSFTSGGKTISVWSTVERVDPLSMGGNSQEYRRYVKMVAALEEQGMASRRKAPPANAPGVGFSDFDSSSLTELESLANDGHSDGDDSATPESEGSTDMAKKAAKAAKVKKVKTPRTVRNCACGCGGETTGYFVPGHDARMHGWIKKLGDGRIDINGKDAKSGEKIIPNAVLKSLVLTKTAKGAKAGAPHFWNAE